MSITTSKGINLMKMERILLGSKDYKNKNAVIEELKKFDINQMRYKNLKKIWGSVCPPFDDSCKFVVEDRYKKNGDFTIYYKHHAGSEIEAKNGIKILGMTPAFESGDGREGGYGCGWGLTVKELKQQGRANGIKRYSKLKKLGLIKKLQAI